MSDVSPIQRPNPPTLARAARPQSATAMTEAPTRGSDRVEFSAASQYLAKLAALPPVRQGLVERVQQQINDGTYESTEKIDAAIENLGEDVPG
jgi:negative regulator of flagellin synthesis FlgM